MLVHYTSEYVLLLYLHKVKLCHWGTEPEKHILSIPQIIHEWIMNNGIKRRRLTVSKANISQRHFVHNKFHLEVNSGVPGKKRDTNGPSCNSHFYTFYCSINILFAWLRTILLTPKTDWHICFCSFPHTEAFQDKVTNPRNRVTTRGILQ